MCITKKELEAKINERRSLVALKEEAENEIKAIEFEIISYMKENAIDTEITADAKITYKEQTRKSLDKKALAEVVDVSKYEKETIYSVLRIK